MFDEKSLSTFLSCYILGVGSDASKLLDSHLRTILENVRLIYLLEREEAGWDANPNWEDILSLGEQQRLGMVRLNETHSSESPNILSLCFSLCSR